MRRIKRRVTKCERTSPTGDPEMALLMEFPFIRFVVNMVLYFLYVIVKSVVLIQLVVVRLKYKHEIPSCCSKPFYVMASLVSLVFGRPLGVVQRHEDEYRADELDQEHNVPTLYIRKTRLGYQAIELLTIIIAAFCILALNSSLNASVLQVTRICSEDPKIHCYPIAIYPNDSIQNNITQGKEITDCTTICLRYKLSFDLFFAVFGGLATIFTLTMKIVAGTLLFLAEKFTSPGKWLRRICCCCNANCFRVTRIFLALFTLCAEYGLIFAAHLFDTQSFEEDTLPQALQKLFPRVALVVGIVSTALWLPWEKYASNTSNNYNPINH